MKKNSLVIVALLLSELAFGQYLFTDGTNSMSGNLNIIREGYSSIELKSNTGAFIDFHTTVNSDFDGRIIWNYNNNNRFTIYGKTQFNNSLTLLGNVGIGETNPQIKLHIKTTNTNSEILRLDGGTRTTSLIDYFDGTYNNAGLQFKKNSLVGQFKFSNNNGDLLTILSNGKLHISNSSLNSELLILDGGTRTTSLINYSDGTYDNAGLQFKKNSTVGQFKFSNNNGDLMTIRSNGNVGIGTTNAFGYKLAVNGTIGSTEVKVENTSAWPDFVFENNYELRTLEEVEDYISENEHLPEIPSEEEVTENGINLGEMDAKLLQKIEELTLYMIDMNKRMKQIETENTELKAKVQSLKNE